MDRFRRYRKGNSNNNKADDDTVPVLVCTDLAARGLDIPSVDAIVQLQFAGNVVSHLHRMGRCGRITNSTDTTTTAAAVGNGRQGGRGIVFYGTTEAELVNVVREAEDEQEEGQLSLPSDVQTTMNDDEDGEDISGDIAQQDETKASAAVGSVNKAFSRKRGFTKKREKLKKELAQNET